MSSRPKQKLSGSASLSAPAIRLLARSTPYVEGEILGLREVVKPGDVAIDVGAAAGLYTLELSMLVGDKGRVLSIEPLSFAHTKWSWILGIDRRRNVTGHRLALGESPGSAKISVPVGKFGPVTGRSFLKSRANGLGSNAEFAKHMEVETQVTTLDDLIEKENADRLDFIKIDVEGAEFQVLKGGRRVLAQYKPTLLLEIEDRHIARFDYTATELIAWLKGLGYTMRIWDRTWRNVDGLTPTHRNYLFVHKSRH